MLCEENYTYKRKDGIKELKQAQNLIQIYQSVEHDLHEWIVDTTFSTTDPEVLAELCREHDACNGIYPNGEGKVWESTDIVRRRVLNCLKKYRRYKCIIVSGHTMIGYGQIMELNL